MNLKKVSIKELVDELKTRQQMGLIVLDIDKGVNYTIVTPDGDTINSGKATIIALNECSSHIKVYKIIY